MKYSYEKYGTVRQTIQWLFFAWVVWIGIQFGLFVRHFETGGAAPLYSRPPGVEGFLPIGALVSLKQWLTTGIFNDIHPAALVLFLTIIGMSLVVKKSFCSWLCPVGTVSEATGKLGRRLFGKNFKVWRPLDLFLQAIKYLLLLFFVKVILIDMPAFALEQFLSSPYWMISDVKMLHFFTRISTTALAIIGVLVVLSALFRNFWCRYLCPYGALLGVVSFVSPFKIRRDRSICTACGNCSRSCPSAIPVAEKTTVRSPECIGCLTCIDSCPEKNALRMTPPGAAKPFPQWAIPVLVLSLFAAGVLAGMVTGHWETSLTYEHYRQLIPFASSLGH